MKRIVIYLLSQPLSYRNYERFGIRFWLERDWEVKVFDFTLLLYPIYWDLLDSLGFIGQSGPPCPNGSFTAIYWDYWA